MDLEDFIGGLFVVLIILGTIGLLAVTALFLISIGVWPIVAWGWFGFFAVGGAFAAISGVW